MQALLMLNPRSDTAFVQRATDALDQSLTPDELASRLRAEYPQVVVRPRSIAAESVTVWYVYRDGRWVDPGGKQLDVGPR